ncbi:MAG: hypothetical protein RI897_1818 [Verrucomicrobiota bacterium]
MVFFAGFSWGWWLVESGFRLDQVGFLTDSGEQGSGDLDIQLDIEADVVGEGAVGSLGDEGVGLGGDGELLVFGMEESVVESAGGVGGVVATEVSDQVGVGVFGGEVFAEVVDEQGVGWAIGGAIEVAGDDIGDLVIVGVLHPLGEFVDLGDTRGVGWAGLEVNVPEVERVAGLEVDGDFEGAFLDD